MPPSYQVLPYSIEQLQQFLSLSYKPKFGKFEANLHSIYFENYLDDIDVKTIVAENDYIDRDFLDDYANYYVKCFHKYERKCARIHFFSNSFTKDEFESTLTGSNPALLADLPKSYLGFIVVKPLPKTILGRTCLRTYPEENGRSFPVTRIYTVNLFGINLSVKSLAYQEQDQVVAACATSALWSAFHRTGVLFHHTIPTPIEITKAATNNYLAERRNLPNKGLTVEQMAQAIRTVGLEPFNVNVTNLYNLKSVIYAYLKGGVPVVLVANLYDDNNGEAVLKGLHGITIAGYCVDDRIKKSHLKSKFILKSSGMNKVYAHDDQVGPFARMEFDNEPVILITGKKKEEKLPSLSTSWKSDFNADLGHVRAVPTAVLVPIYNKIRIPFELVHDVIMNFNILLQTVVTASFKKDIVWDIFLSNINTFKESILHSTVLSSQKKKEILTEGMPRFIWRAIATIEGDSVIELLFDATDIEQGNIFLRGILYDENFFVFLITLLKQCPESELITGSPSAPIYEWLLHH